MDWRRCQELVESKTHPLNCQKMRAGYFCRVNLQLPQSSPNARETRFGHEDASGSRGWSEVDGARMCGGIATVRPLPPDLPFFVRVTEARPDGSVSRFSCGWLFGMNRPYLVDYLSENKHRPKLRAGSPDLSLRRETKRACAAEARLCVIRGRRLDVDSRVRDQALAAVAG